MGSGDEGMAGVPGREGRKRRLLGEFGGAFGDLGTLLPLVLGAITVAGMPAAGVLFGFGVAFLGSGLFYGLPMPVQPMKAIAAVILTGGLDARQVAAAGVLTGIVLLLLGATGAMARIARLIPRSVTAGLQLGLGLSMGLLGLRLAWETPWLGVLALALLVLLMRLPRWPAAPAMLLAIVLVGWGAGVVETPPAPAFGLSLPPLVLPSLPDAWHALWGAVVPQTPLTLTNAVIVTAALARDLFPDARRVDERSLCLSTGVANLALAPLGAMPMCHGAGGLQAQHRFGARTGAAPVLLGGILLTLALGFGGWVGDLFAFVPPAAIGALLLVAGADLAASKRLLDARPDCWPAIGIAAAATLLANPAAGLACGWVVELGRSAAATAIRGVRSRDEK
jgi:MFS superfamily sulfate permease-like transporter